jgi:hypothetical protein
MMVVKKQQRNIEELKNEQVEESKTQNQQPL